MVVSDLNCLPLVMKRKSGAVMWHPRLHDLSAACGSRKFEAPISEFAGLIMLFCSETIRNVDAVKMQNEW
jgi:hypothetical protein